MERRREFRESVRVRFWFWEVGGGEEVWVGEERERLVEVVENIDWDIARTWGDYFLG